MLKINLLVSFISYWKNGTQYPRKNPIRIPTTLIRKRTMEIPIPDKVGIDRNFSTVYNKKTTPPKEAESLERHQEMMFHKGVGKVWEIK